MPYWMLLLNIKILSFQLSKRRTKTSAVATIRCIYEKKNKKSLYLFYVPFFNVFISLQEEFVCLYFICVSYVRVFVDIDIYYCCCCSCCSCWYSMLVSSVELFNSCESSKKRWMDFSFCFSLNYTVSTIPFVCVFINTNIHRKTHSHANKHSNENYMQYIHENNSWIFFFFSNKKYLVSCFVTIFFLLQIRPFFIHQSAPSHALSWNLFFNVIFIWNFEWMKE